MVTPQNPVVTPSFWEKFSEGALNTVKWLGRNITDWSKTIWQWITQVAQGIWHYLGIGWEYVKKGAILTKDAIVGHPIISSVIGATLVAGITLAIYFCCCRTTEPKTA